MSLFPFSTPAFQTNLPMGEIMKKNLLRHNDTMVIWLIYDILKFHSAGSISSVMLKVQMRESKHKNEMQYSHHLCKTPVIIVGDRYLNLTRHHSKNSLNRRMVTA